MAGQTRVNGSGKSAAGDVHYPGAFAFKILVKIANGTAVDLRAEDDALDETVEQICKEINPLVYHTTNDASGTMTVVCDNSATAADLQARIRLIGKASNYPTSTVTAVGPNNICLLYTSPSPRDPL